MVDHTDRFRPLQMTPGCYRIPDGHIVPNPPRPTPEPLPASYYPPHRGGLVTTIAVCAGIVLALMAAGIAGVLR